MATGNSKELCEYKQKVISQILNCDSITSALSSASETSELLYQNIFPHGMIPGTTGDAKCYITVEVTMPQVSTVNYFFKDVLLVINVICHVDMMRTSYGMPRTDYIAVELDKLFNGNTTMGVGKMELVSNTEGMFTERHACRTLRFQTQEMTRELCDADGYYVGDVVYG